MEQPTLGIRRHDGTATDPSTYEVRVAYRGARSYIVAAPVINEEIAAAIAKERYQSGDNGEDTGTEWEEIISIIPLPLADQLPEEPDEE